LFLTALNPKRSFALAVCFSDEEMQVLEKKIPWWRKALNFALDGLRSGFGLFSRREAIKPVPEAEFSGSLEESLEEKTTLTELSLEPEVTEPEASIAASAAPTEPVALAETIPAAEAVVEAAPEAAESTEAAAVPEAVESAEPPVEHASVNSFVSGHDFSRAANAAKSMRALAPEGSPSPITPDLPPSPAAEDATTSSAAAPLVLTAEPTAEEEASKKAEEKAAAKLVARQKKLDESSAESPFSVVVGQVYDGPLDLLLDLIRKQDIDIYDIPIAKITAQFLAYVNQLKATDVDVAGEFIYTASLLIHIKSKLLLPRAPSGPEDEAEDPRRELVERLLEHERFKNAAQMLQQKQMLEAASWTNPGLREFKDDVAAEPEIAADTDDLIRVFSGILERARKRPVLDVTEDSVTVGQMIQFLARRLTMEDKPVALRRLLSHTRSERALIAMFLALLELVRLQAILLRQDRAFCEIFVKKNTDFDTVMNDGMISAHDDWR
jgi:segregation and condensation protein A